MNPELAAMVAQIQLTIRAPRAVFTDNIDFDFSLRVRFVTALVFLVVVIAHGCVILRIQP